MDTSSLREITTACWEIPEDRDARRAAVEMFASRPLLLAMDEKVREQIMNVARLPGLVGAALTMPDAHWGYGFPIGGVAAFDPDQGGVISAGGVGFDISCGIRCLRTDLAADTLAPVAEPLADALFRAIPAGVGVEGSLRLSPARIDEVMVQGAEWAVAEGYGVPDDLDFIEERGRIGSAVPENVSDQAKKRQRGEMGTLGSGNHYLEVQKVERILDANAATAFGIFPNQVLISIHCGSRGLGHQIGTEYLLKLAKAAGRLGIELPDRELACAPIRSPEGQEYIGAMNAAINCALANRQILASLTRDVFERFFRHNPLTTLFDVSHNTCKLEEHTVAGEIRRVYVHRKGATRAFGPGHPTLPKPYEAVGQPVIIGGSMGTGSYVLAGNPPAQNRAFSSASHGAGRSMSRRQALRHWQGKPLIDELARSGILIRTRSFRGAAEEAPGAYKDVDAVAQATEDAGLARRVAFLRPLICVKG